MNTTLKLDLNYMNNIYNRVAKWNSQRYDQEYNHELAVSLLREEYNEWRRDEEAVKKLDGLCDVVFVAFGVLWKAKVDEAVLNKAQDQAIAIADITVEHSSFAPGYAIGLMLDVFEYEAKQELALVMCSIIYAAVAQALSMGLTYDQFIEALHVVCDSNDSKSIKRVASDIKANAGDKGPYFIAPEPRLQAILDKVEALND